MAGPKDYLTPEQYERWYARHKVVERQRQWKVALEKNPINELPEEERGELPETYSLAEAYWHPIGCECGSCEGPAAEAAKQLRLSERPVPPAIKSVVSRLPPLPDHVRLHLQAVEEAVQSREDPLTLLPAGRE